MSDDSNIGGGSDVRPVIGDGFQWLSVTNPREPTQIGSLGGGSVRVPTAVGSEVGW
ncbi:hypothetical protein HanRHA438_Chr08g0359931 [Helianthus annuus]|uniref:Uncharacterized protein n=1 Tax=Helianthus annuus TaxID=4232 RepID=A0A251U8T9_HELAN|nr:hypothetical protein HanXRQr2_Chr08g0347701 [Helianthus annuus]KAJ0554227.1 hypothetical protein HanHA89_Chr08g0305311 [Helianthus annuus]KAJ0892013.1 hypothetical protein HanPSC8_Chr09g0360861 [Helianthus annuus]KAJ0898712.1 hypothetical protein HanRHA438_Chr08g0359931 [Helianthus annuus]